MPQPLPKHLYNSEIHICNSDDSPSTHRPALALLAMSVIAEWSILDSLLNAIFVKLLGLSAEIGFTIFDSITGAAAQRAAFSAVAQLRLNEDEFEVFSALADEAKSIRKIRNSLAHGVWGHAAKIPDGVLLVDAADLMKAHVSQIDVEANKTKFNPGNFPIDKIQVYYATDFEKTSERIRNLMAYVKVFTIIISPNPGHPLDGLELDRLARVPGLQTALSPRLREQKIRPAMT